MIRQTRGFILFTTILMLSVLSMLVLSLLNSLYLNIKISNQLVKTHKDFYQLEDLAWKISQNIQSYAMKRCSITNIDMSTINKSLLIKRGCRIDDKISQYYYIISDLGLFPCVEIDVSGVKYSSRHWLVSIFKYNSVLKIVNLRVALPDVISSCGIPINIHISSGIISYWEK